MSLRDGEGAPAGRPRDNENMPDLNADASTVPGRATRLSEASAAIAARRAGLALREPRDAAARQLFGLVLDVAACCHPGHLELLDEFEDALRRSQRHIRDGLKRNLDFHGRELARLLPPENA
jgi:hypothetical protein